MGKILRKIYRFIDIWIVIDFIQFLNKIHLYLIKNSGKVYSRYEALTPNENADNIDSYSEMLQEVLERPKINNIAITGTYGSGKSSFLRTFENQYKEWNYLHISLATFEEYKNTNNQENQDNEQKNKDIKQQQNQLLERSILQQIFYKEKDKTIPFSRFKRIINIKKSSLIIHSICIGILILYCLTIFSPTKMEQFLIGYDLKSLLEQYSFIFLPIIILIFAYYFYKIIQYVTKLKVSKFNIKSGEFQVNNKDKSSILNEHLDEILYFFEVTKYNVIVIEDLDRFDNSEIFIKLRELNTLINNAKYINNNNNRKVTFIYAIKDDMFKDKERTKFFDFIIPIIPYINSSNSFDKFKEIINKGNINKEKINDDFLRDISLRIDDMRLLKNIVNEYKIYKLKLKSDKLNKERLLAMIIYKNFYPSDFAKLHINEGDVFDIFNKKLNFIGEKVNKIKKQIQDKENEITEYNSKIELEKNKTIEELRMVYILKIFEKLNQIVFFIQSKQYFLSNIKNLINDENFEVIKTGEIKKNNNSYDNTIVTTFSQIEKEINPKLTYDQREEIILNQTNKNLENLKQELQDLKNQQNEVKNYSIGKLIQEGNINIFEKIEDKKLLKFLIREGYIREDYHNYISYFFEGSLTYGDRDFVLSVQNDDKIFSRPEYLLTNIDSVINSLELKYFKTDLILNYSLLDYMLEKIDIEKDEKFKNFISILANDSKTSKNFIFDFLEITKHKVLFIDIIARKWEEIWLYIYEEFATKEQHRYFEILINNLKVEDLIKLNKNNSLKSFIESDFLHMNIISFSNFKILVAKLNIKYKIAKNISLIKLWVYENNLYELNEEMIIYMLSINSELENKDKNASYSAIQKSNADKLKEYVKQNINEYIENVFLKIGENIQEDEKFVLELLNNEDDLKFENKQKIIQKVETKISDISQIENQKLWGLLLKENKIEPIWNNLLHYYQYVENVFDEVLLNFINIEDNAKKLSAYKIYNEKDFDKEIIEQLDTDIIKSDQIEDNSYSHIVKSLYQYTIIIDELSEIKIDILLDNNKLLLTQKNINSLKEYFPNKQIILIEKFKKEFFEKYEEFTLDIDDYIEILKSPKFEDNEKISIIDKLDLSMYDNQEFAKALINIYLKNSIEISNEIFFKLFDKSDFDDGLKLLINQISKLEEQEISDLLNQFEEPYSKLTEKSAKRLKFDNNEINKNLLGALNGKNIIGKVSIEKKEIIVNRKRK